MNSILAFRIAAILGFLGVAFGASGAHGRLHDILTNNHSLDAWKTAVLYQFVHVVVLLIIATRQPFNAAAYYFLLAGVILFSGSIYTLSAVNLGSMKSVIGPLTPLGGVCLLIGWILLCVKAR